MNAPRFMPRLAIAALWLGSTTLAFAQPPSTPSPADTPEPPQTAPAPQAPLPPQAPPPPPAGAAPSKPVFTFAFHGFAGVTLFAQDAQTKVAEGQLAMWAFPQQNGAAPAAIGGKQPNTDRTIFNGDIRQTRLNFSAAGPQIWAGATPKAVIELDLAGGYGSGNYGDISLVPRVRLGYVELDWGPHRLLFGQQNDLTLPFVSYSLSHLAFPLSFATGLVGWRRPGVFGYHTVAGERTGGFLELAWEIGAPHWGIGNNIGAQAASTAASPAAAGAGDRFGFNSGEASGVPVVEGRVLVGHGTSYQLYATGHYGRLDRSGADASSSALVRDLDVVALQTGGRAMTGPLTLQFQAFTGKNLAQLTGEFLQFQPAAVGDVHEYGAYVQAGFNFTPEWSIWGMIGTDKINQADAAAAHAVLSTFGVHQNVVSQAFVQYRLDKLGLSLEWTHFHTKTFGSTPSLDANLDANQVAFNTIYFF